jgi:hypothetical protein
MRQDIHYQKLYLHVCLSVIRYLEYKYIRSDAEIYYSCILSSKLRNGLLDSLGVLYFVEAYKIIYRMWK